MLTEDAVKHFGSRSAVARALGIKKAAVCKWGARVPPLRAQQIHALTAGDLPFDPADYIGTTTERLAAALSVPNEGHAA